PLLHLLETEAQDIRDAATAFQQRIAGHRGDGDVADESGRHARRRHGQILELAEERIARLDTILQGLAKPGQADADASVARVKQILGSDISTLIPLATLANSMRGLQNVADVPHGIEQGLLAYFFSGDGYKTVDSESVVAPVHLS